MKKIQNILTTLLFLGLLSSYSCSNDDIPMEYVAGRHDVTFKVNTYSILEAYEKTVLICTAADEILLNAPGHTLRVRLLIYDNNDKLVSISEKSVDNFRSTVDFVINLPEGKYKSVSICDLINTTNGQEYWAIKDTELKTTLKLVRNTTSLGTLGAMIGTNISDITVKESEEINCNLKPQFSLYYTQFEEIHANMTQYLKDRYQSMINVDHFSLYTYTYPRSIQLSSSGEFETSFEVNEDKPFDLLSFKPSEIDDNTFYGFVALFPTSYMKLGVAAVDKNNDYWLIGDEEQWYINNVPYGGWVFSMRLLPPVVIWYHWDNRPS